MVVSACGGPATFRLLREDVLQAYGLPESIPKLAPSNGHITAFVGLDGPLKMNNCVKDDDADINGGY